METILRLGAEGGSITLQGERIAQGWRFLREMSDSTPVLIDEPCIEHRSETVGSWEAAVRLLDGHQRRWHMLSPRTVHAEFRELIWREVMRKHESDPLREYRLESWREKCGLPPEAA